jgi:hypothetical protein
VAERTGRNQGGTSGAAKTVQRRANGSLEVPGIPAFGGVTLKTDPIVVQAWKAQSFSTSGSSSGRSVTTITSHK